MTEAEWLVCDDAIALNFFVAYRAPVSERKVRLAACSCCRTLWPHLLDPRSTAAVEVAEQFADGAATENELQRAGANAREVIPAHRWGLTPLEFARLDPTERIELLAGWSAEMVSRLGDSEGMHSHLAEMIGYAQLIAASRSAGSPREAVAVTLADLLRDVFGNPFRQPITLPLSWLASSVNTIARTIYNDRSFADLPILADALEDAGCDDADLLAHCRSAGPHVRGCWAVDLILGKE